MGSEGYELASLIDLDRVQRLCDSLSEAFDVPLAVLDPSGTILIATGWQDICTRYHREHPDTLQACLESDLRINQRLVEGLGQSEHYAYRCSNGLWDVAFPLIVAGEHVANVYTGQFFFDDDDVDRAAFADRARRLGFDESAYLEALDRVPVISQAHLQKTMGFLADFVNMLGEMGLKALQHERKHALLVESEERYRRLFDNSAEGLTVFRVEPGGDGEDGDLVVVDLNPTQARRTRTTREQLLGRRRSECDGSDERLRAYFDVVAGAVAAARPARCEVYLRGQGAYELLSAYPAAKDLWVLSATDVTELREAERALRRKEEGIRHAYEDVLDAVTGGKLILLTDEQLTDELGTPLGHQLAFGAPAELGAARRRIVRAAETCFPGRIRHTDLLSTVGEALDNALKHAGGGAYQVFARDDCLQVAISDDGPGIDFRTLPRATLVPGFSTAASLGMGFTIMLQLCARVLLTTRPGHTVVVLEFVPAPEPALEPAGGRPDAASA
jgi:ligand-binding sensor protein/anti-sigma regulatory factor (Ser/Thr protein kinase)